MKRGKQITGKILSLVLCAVLAVSILPVFSVSVSADENPQVILIKLDDIREGVAVRAGFQRAYDYLLSKTMHASFGLIGASLVDDGKKDDYYKQVKLWADSGSIEIWHHGYYHTAGTVEFSGGSYEEQYKQMKDTIDLMQEKCGITLHTFGAPFNSSDATTVEVLNALPQMKAVFFPTVTENSNALCLTDSAALETAVGVIDYDAFINSYNANKDKPYLVLQGHPGGWNDESFNNFTKIIDFLDTQNVVYMTPYEYYCTQTSTSDIFPKNFKYNKSAADRDVMVVRLILNGNTLESVYNGTTELKNGTDYTIMNEKVVISKEYLDSIGKGKYTLTFKFSKNDDATLALNIIDPTNEPVKVVLDGEMMKFDVEPVILEGRTMVPFRVIFEGFGASVDWDDETKTAFGQLEETTISLPIGSTTAMVNNKPVTLDAAATIIDGRTLVPLRFVSENFGAKVDWDDETRTATIKSGPKKTAITEDSPWGGLKIVSVKSVLNDPEMELWTLDGKIVADDRWAAEGDNVWIQYELDSLQTVGSVQIAWFKGNERIESFSVQTSADGIEYTEVYRGQGSGTTDQLETYTLQKPAEAKYVRIYCHGNNSTASTYWNSILEAAIFAK